MSGIKILALNVPQTDFQRFTHEEVALWGERGMRSESREQEDKKEDYQLSTQKILAARVSFGVEKLYSYCTEHEA